MNDQEDMLKPKPPAAKSAKRHVIVTVGFFALTVALTLGSDEVRELLEKIDYLLTTTPGYVLLVFVCMVGIIYESPRDEPGSWMKPWSWKGGLIANLVALVIGSVLIAMLFGLLYRIMVNILGAIAAGIMLINTPVWLHHILSVHHLREELQAVEKAIHLTKDKK
jgi:hypothetical protein